MTACLSRRGRVAWCAYRSGVSVETTVEETGERSSDDIWNEVFNRYRQLFASAPIRLMSRTVSAMRSLGFDDLATAIGDLDWRTVPVDDVEDPSLRHDWQAILEPAYRHVEGWLRQLAAQPLGYNLDSVGYPTVTRAWSGLWSHQLGIEFTNRPHQAPEIAVFHGGNQALEAAFLGAAEARRKRLGNGSAPTILVPIPTFSCPLDQMALHGMRTFLLPPSDPAMDPSPGDLDQVDAGVDVDALYLMPINNPTGRTLPPARLRAIVEAVLERWPHAAIVLDSVYVRMHPRYRELLDWYEDDPRFADSILFIDSLSKTHGVTGLRAGVVLTRSARLRDGVVRYAQNVMAGPSNAMQAVVLGLLAPFASGDEERIRDRIRLQLRIGRHLQRRRRLLLASMVGAHGALLHPNQPVLPDPEHFDWEGSMYADLRLSESCIERARRRGVPPTVELYLETGIGGVPLEGFCRNHNLDRHGLVVNADDPVLRAFQERAAGFVRLSFGMTPPPPGK